MRFICLMVLCSLLSPVAHARDLTKYKDVDFADLTKFAAHYNTLKLSDDTAFANYLQVTECDLYKSASTSQFTMQEIKQAVIDAYKKEKDQNRQLHVKIPMTLQVSGYNFDTQSLTLMPLSQLKKVNMLQITTDRFTTCGRDTNRNLTAIPALYYVKTNFPISLFRIPLQRNLAQQLESRLDRVDVNSTTHQVYGLLYVTIEALSPEIVIDGNIPKATLFGQVDVINLYIDPDYKLPLKTLNYADNM